jgi:tetratricopeptide (TPR) repeat protein
MKHITADADVTDASIQDLKLSMHLNISLCHYRQGQWNETIRACNEALALKNDNVKALFRRGVAYSRKGFLDEARSDLAKVCHKTPQDAQARGELKNVHDKLMQARQRDKKVSARNFGYEIVFFYIIWMW